MNVNRLLKLAAMRGHAKNLREATCSLAGEGGCQTQICFGRKNKMTLTKTLKTLLCATVATAAISTVAYADSLSALKSMMTSMTKRDVAAKVGTQVPTGITIFSTADAPPADGAAVEEPFIEVKMTGYIKGGYIYSEIKDTPPTGSLAPKDASSDFDGEAGTTIKGSVQSTLGEVGGSLSLKWQIAESLDNAVSLGDDGFSGFWQFNNNMKFDIGRGSAGALDNGIEKNTRRIMTVAHKRVRAERAGNGFFDDKAVNFYTGLTYAEGPMTLQLRMNDATRGVLDAGKIAGYDDDAIGFSGKGTLNTDMINFEMAGGMWGQDNADLLPLKNRTGTKWLAGIGTEINAIEGVSISLAAQAGELHSGAKTTNYSGSLGFTLTDDITAGIGAGWKKVSNSPAGSPAESDHTERVINGGIYYAPLANMIIGVEGDWLDDGKTVAHSNDGYTGALVTKYSF
jgi:hypothetical protein